MEQKENKKETIWIYGRHAALAALANPYRRCKRLLVTHTMIKEITKLRSFNHGFPAPEVVSNATLTVVTRQTTHQGIAVQVYPFEPLNMKEMVKQLSAYQNIIIVILDQITDPHNIGAILRSSAAFGVLAIIIPKHRTPKETASLAKVASGGLEIVPLVQTNINKAIETLKLAGFLVIGLNVTSSFLLQSITFPNRIALVFGSEDHGLRCSVKARCDSLVCLPTTGIMKSLNVSNAVAVALYEVVRTKLEIDQEIP